MISEDIVIQLREERRALDKLHKILLAADIDYSGDAAEMFTKMAFMWLGKALGAVGTPNPYPHSTDPSSKRIEPATDLYEGDALADIDLDDDVAVIKYLRGELERVSKQIRTGLQLNTTDALYIDCVRQAWGWAENAKLSLGLALGEIRDRDERRNLLPEGGSSEPGQQGQQDPPPPVHHIPEAGGDAVDTGAGGPPGGPVLLFDPKHSLQEDVKSLQEGGRPPIESVNLIDIFEYMKVGRPIPAQKQLGYITRKLAENSSVTVNLGSDYATDFLNQVQAYLAGTPAWAPLVKPAPAADGEQV